MTTVHRAVVVVFHSVVASVMMLQGGDGVAEPFKNAFNLDTVELLADAVERAHPEFDRTRFRAFASDGFEDLELTQRGRRVADALRHVLPEDPAVAIGILVNSLPPFVEAERLRGLDGFRFMPFTIFVSTYGIECFDASMKAQHILTQHFTAEASIRPFIEKEPERTLAVLRSWTSDPSEHVRRLVSEGTRPRLPWSGRLRRFERDPEPVIELLELLKNDPSEYVRRSVANNLNDIAKDHPDRVLDLCEAWKVDATPARAALISHALRSLVKAGHPRALALLGARHDVSFEIERPRIEPPAVEIGGAVRISFDVRNTGERTERFVIDYRVHFVKASGATSAKTFKLTFANLEPGAVRSCSILRSVEQRTTRVHYPGRHEVEAVVNGHPYSLGTFDLRCTS